VKRNALLEAGDTGNSLGCDKLDGYLLGSYRIATAPEPNSSRLTSFRSIRFDSPANNVGPWPAKEEGIGLLEVLDRVTMQVFLREHCTMIAAPVQCDIDGIPKGSHYSRVQGIVAVLPHRQRRRGRGRQ
jgi:hypothetical protein